ncbi:MAG TPA: 23S rRNA (adenine(2030)-N(6))-methyltransferase RlmJ [Pseudolabrys sp.]
MIDTHAGSGLYDLGGEKALRGGEWQDGIGKLMAAKIPEATAALLWPYLEVVRALNDRNRLRVYPDSPALARAWLRAQDRLIACEPEPKASSSLTRNLEGDARIKNGWTGYECLRATKGSGAAWCWSILHSRPTVIFRALPVGWLPRTGIYMLDKRSAQADAFAQRVRRLRSGRSALNF